MQKEYILKFLAANGFPLGVVACSESISTDPHIKTLYLARLIREVGSSLEPTTGTSLIRTPVEPSLNRTPVEPL